MMARSTYFTCKGLSGQIQYFETELKKIDNKIDAIEAFLGKTGGIYNAEVAMLNLLNEAGCEFWSSITVGDIENMYPVTNITTKWEEEFKEIYLRKH